MTLIKFFLSLILYTQLLIGTQATVTSGNIADVASLGGNIVQLDNLHIYDNQATIDAQAARADLVHNNGMKVHAILYVNKDDSFVDFANFFEDVVQEVDADVWQIGQEVDQAGGVPGYYGGWGYAYIDLYKTFVQQARAVLDVYAPSAQLIVGISANTGYNTWLTQAETVGLSSYVDAYGIHLYAIYPTAMYNQAAWESIVSTSRACVSKPVWVTETGLRYLSGDAEDFAQAQADFITDVFTDMIDFRVPVVMYYGYNPGWEGVDIKNNTLAKDAFRVITGNYLNTVTRSSKR